MTPIPLAEPPHHDGTVRIWTLDSYDQLAQLRADVTRAVATPAGGRDTAQDEVVQGLVLASSELATNALKHADAPAVVTLVSADGAYLLDVADHAPTTPPRSGRGRSPGDGGFGLVVVATVASSVGWYATDSTKHVWATFETAER